MQTNNKAIKKNVLLKSSGDYTKVQPCKITILKLLISATKWYNLMINWMYNFANIYIDYDDKYWKNEPSNTTM